jgi:hypothetical protein
MATRSRRLAPLGAASLLAALLAQCATGDPLFKKELPWAARGVWLKAETHVHTQFSDGSHSVDEVVDRAVVNGCDVLAITDHTDANLKAATPEYHAAIEAARQRVKDKLTVITGLEWNVPPGKGDDHAVVLLPPHADVADLAGDFKRRFDDFDKSGENPELAVSGFDWLKGMKTDETATLPVVFLNHPSRRADSAETVFQRLRTMSDIGGAVFVGAEGAPGHQKATPLGAYDRELTPDDRWDPSIARPGAAWDRVLTRDVALSGALATADFHSEANGDYWPCEFSATWIYAADRSPAAVLEALRAGSFAGVHGHIANKPQLSLQAEGLPRAAIPGETVEVPAETQMTAVVAATVPPTDWENTPNRIDTIDLIAVSKDGTAIMNSGPPDSGGTYRYTFVVPEGGLTIRARGRRVVADGPDLLFYTNPVVIR